jgi:hypothetical protein
MFLHCSQQLITHRAAYKRQTNSFEIFMQFLIIKYRLQTRLYTYHPQQLKRRCDSAHIVPVNEMHNIFCEEIHKYISIM